MPSSPSLPSERAYRIRLQDVMLTREEMEVIDDFGEAYARFRELPVCHPADLEEVKVHVHAIQNTIMARAAVRSRPEEFGAVEGFE